MLFTRAKPVQDEATQYATTQEVEVAAAHYLHAVDQSRNADRVKRSARKLLDRLPPGRYGAFRVEHVPSGREVADLDAIRKIFSAYGLGPVPMKVCEPSLKVSRTNSAILS